MNKSKQLIGASLALFTAVTPSLYAGTMGAEDPIMFSNSIVPFMSLEGGYTWNELRGFHFSTVSDSIHSTTKHQNWSGRFAGGILIPYCDTISFSSELAYGYYGETRFPLKFSGSLGAFTVDPSGFDLRSTISGLDILAGVYYRPGGYELFLKGGGLIENTNLRTQANFATLTFNRFGGDTHINETHTEVLPVVKLGASFNFGTNWAVLGAWTHAFGSTPHTNAHFGAEGLTGIAYNSNTNGPTLDIAMLGVQYNFA